MYIALALSQRLVDWLNGTGYSPGHPISDPEQRDELQLGELLDIVAALDGTSEGLGSDLIGVYDSGGVFTGDTLTEVLAELYTAATTAGSDTFTDSGNFYAVDTVGSAFVALGTALGGTNSTTRDYTGGTGTRLLDNDSFFTAVNKLDQGFVDLISAANAKGASLVGVEDSGTFYAGATVETVLAEIGKHLPSNVVADPGNGQPISVVRSGHCGLSIGAGVESGTIANPAFLGQEIQITAFEVLGGSRAIAAASQINQAGNTAMAFANARDTLTLKAILTAAGLRWQVTANDGVVLS